MSAALSFRFGLLSAGLSCLFAGVVVAQQGQSSSGQSSSQRSSAQRDNSARSATSGQTGGSSSAQSGQSSSQQGTGQSGQSGQSYTANFRGESAGGQSQAIDTFYASCLLAQNQGEVELSELAQQQAQSPEVKQFAQQMIQDHRQMIQQLQQIAGGQSSSGSSGSTGSSGTSRSSSSQRGSSSSSDTDTSSSGSDTSSALGTSGTSATDLPGTSSASGTTSVGGLSSAASGAGLSGSGGSGVAMQLAATDMQIAQRKTQMEKEELQQKQGAEFDKAFVGTAIPAHIHALAALEVLGQQSQGQLAQVAQQARPKVQQHLDHPKQLMRQLDQQSGSSNNDSQADRSSSRTQR